ncbi:MAG: DMT family transporter [Candidatus Aminicenantaceae bacterium]
MEEYRKFGTTDVFMFMAVVFWAINFSFIKIALREFSPFAFNAIRLIFASLALILVLLFRKEVLSFPKSQIWKMLSMGIIGNTIFQILFIHGINLTTASNTSIIMAMTPIFIALINSFLKHEKISWAAWVGIFISLFGCYLVITRGAGAISFSLHYMRGDLMILGGNLCWAYYTVCAKPLLESISPLKLTAITMAIGAVFFIPFAAQDIYQIPLTDISQKAWAALFYSAIFALVISYVIWYASVKKVGNTKTAIYGNITPIVTAVFAYIFISERLTFLQIVGMLTILAGVYLARSGYRYFQKNRVPST